MNITKIIFIAFIFVVSASVDAFTQDAAVPLHPREERAERMGRPNLFRLLGLTPEQKEQIKALNVERRDRLVTAQTAHRQAMQALDGAIYAATVNEADVAAKLRELQRAQAELSRLRAEMELGVRRILSPEQLEKFRELRRQFAARRRGPGGEFIRRPERRMLKEQHMPRNN